MSECRSRLGGAKLDGWYDRHGGYHWDGFSALRFVTIFPCGTVKGRDGVMMEVRGMMMMMMVVVVVG